MTPVDWMGTFAAMLAADPHAPLLVHLRAQMRAAAEAEQRAAERRMRRAMQGSCECGEVAGEAECPWCDDEALPADLREAGARLLRVSRVRQADRDAQEALAKLTAEAPKALQPHAPRPPNRHERRRARSRRRG